MSILLFKPLDLRDPVASSLPVDCSRPIARTVKVRWVVARAYPTWLYTLHKRPVILSWGAGIDSGALLLSYLLEPEYRDFDLSDLVVIHAHTGSEWPETVEAAEGVYLPLLYLNGVRVIQAARASDSQSDGVVILHDSHHDRRFERRHQAHREIHQQVMGTGMRSPLTYQFAESYNDSNWPCQFYHKGARTLAGHLMENATVPQVQTGRRLCTLHYKAFVIDYVVRLLFGESPQRRFIGYNWSEQGRAENDANYSLSCRYQVGYNGDERQRASSDSSLMIRAQQGYSYQLAFNDDERQRTKEESVAWRPQLFEFPLIQRGWGRAFCENYCRQFVQRCFPGLLQALEAVVEDLIDKSFCGFCCFACSSGSKIAAASGVRGVSRELAALLSESKEDILLRKFRRHPHLAGEALMIEHIALAINPTQYLYGSRCAYDVINNANIPAAIADFERRKQEIVEWAVFVVRRIFKFKGKNGVMRQTKIVFRGTEDDCNAHVKALASAYGREAKYIERTWRFWSIPRLPAEVEKFPHVEELFTVAPAFVKQKQNYLTEADYAFEWACATGSHPTVRSTTIEETIPMPKAARKAPVTPISLTPDGENIMFEVVQGTQCDHSQWTSFLTIGDIKRTFSVPDASTEPDPMQIHQRVYDENRAAKQVAPYILKGVIEDGNYYRLPAVTIGFKASTFRVVNYKEQWTALIDAVSDSTLRQQMQTELQWMPRGRSASLILPPDTEFFTYDGQHRQGGMLEAILKSPDFMDGQELAVLFMEDLGLQFRRQVFVDFNSKGKIINSSQLTLFNQRDTLDVTAKVLMEQAPFKGHTAWEKSTVKATKPHELFVLKALRDATKGLLAGIPPAEHSDQAIAYWQAVAAAHPHWVKIKTATPTQLVELKETTFSFHVVTLKALGMVGNHLLKQEDWKGKLAGLKNINWNQDNPDWESVILAFGRVQTDQAAVGRMAMYIQSKLNS